MEYWGVEVKPNERLKVTIKKDSLLHLSLAALGQTTKANKDVVLFINFEERNLVLGTLSSGKCPLFSYDLIFEKDFELFHNSTHGSVYFSGYKSEVLPVDLSDGSEGSDSEDDIHFLGKPGPITSVEVGSSAAKGKVETEDAECEDDDSKGSSDEGESDEEVKQSKQRPSETSAYRTPADKKPDSAAGKKGNGSHEATHHSVKRAGETDKSKQETPKSAASPGSCHPCSKTFNSEKGLESHTKAKKAGESDKSKQETLKSAATLVSCHTCSKTFNSEKGLESHTKAKHSSCSLREGQQ